MRTAGDAFFVRDRLRRLCEEWSALTPGCAVLPETMIFSCAVRFRMRRLEGMLCVHV